MIKIGTKVKLVVGIRGDKVAGKVVDIDDNNALIEIMKMGNWHYHCSVDELTKLTEQEENEFYGLKSNEIDSWQKRQKK